MIPPQIIKYAVMGLGLLSAGYAVVDHFETKGYNRAIVELQSIANAEIQKATEKATAKAAKEMQKALDKQQLLHDNELERTKQEREVEVQIKRMIEYVDRIEIKTECITVGDDIIRVLNKTITESNVTSN